MNSDDQVFPSFVFERLGEIHSGQSHGGLTKREYFAVMALRGLLSGQGGPVVINGSELTMDKASVLIADNLIKSLGEN